MVQITTIERQAESGQLVLPTGAPVMSWGSIVAGALTATAIAFILLSLGAGIGFLEGSPYASGPSAKTLTILGAIWIVLSQAWGYAVGGYLAGRMRTPADVLPTEETNFRDGAHGLAAWALGVLLTVVLLAFGAHLGATIGAGALNAGGSAAGAALSNVSTGYYADSLLRAAAPPANNAAAGQTPPAAATPQASAPLSQQEQGEVVRIFTAGLRDGKLSADDRTYLAHMVQARTGLSQEDAGKRVDDTLNRLNSAAKDAADKAAKAASYLSFWSFIALIFGAAAAVLGGIVGGNQRDEQRT
jgi:hypothetical protein